MKKMLLAALIAATALSPVVASAQEWQGRRGNRGDGAPQADRPAPPPRPERSMDSFRRPEGPRGGDREAFRAQREAARAQAQVQGQGQVRGPGFDRDAVRAQREAARAQAQVQAQGQVGGPRGDWGRNRDAYRDAYREDRRDDRRDFRNERRDDRRDLANGRVTPDQFRRDRRDDRQDFRNERRDDRRDFARDQRRDGWNRGDWNGGQRWNRQWRNDRRYDWQGWRGQNRQAYRLPRYYPPRGYNYGYQRFGIGITLGSILFQQNYWINDPWDYRLPPAYGPYRWVRYYNDALLVDVDTGEVVDVIYDIFW